MEAAWNCRSPQGGLQCSSGKKCTAVCGLLNDEGWKRKWNELHTDWLGSQIRSLSPEGVRVQSRQLLTNFSAEKICTPAQRSSIPRYVALLLNHVKMCGCPNYGKHLTVTWYCYFILYIFRSIIFTWYIFSIYNFCFYRQNLFLVFPRNFMLFIAWGGFSQHRIPPC